MPENHRLYHSIREVSDMLHIPVSTLRYWEKEVKQLQPHTNAHRTRFYTAEDIELIKTIHHLREDQGLSMEAVKQRLSVSADEAERTRKCVELLKSIREELVHLRELI